MIAETFPSEDATPLHDWRGCFDAPRAIRRQTVKTIRGLRELVNIAFLCGDKKLQLVSSSAVALMKPVKADRIRGKRKKKSEDWQCYGWAVKLSNLFFFFWCLFLLIWDKRGRRGGVRTTLKHRYNTIHWCFVSLGVSAGLFTINLLFALAESLLICSWSPPTLSACWVIKYALRFWSVTAYFFIIWKKAFCLVYRGKSQAAATETCWMQSYGNRERNDATGS